MKISLMGFLRDGAIEKVACGAYRSAVEQAFGTPQDWMLPQMEHSAIWKYGNLEFHFNDNELWMIFTDDFGVPRSNAKLEFDSQILSTDLSLNDAKAFLSHEHIPYTENSDVAGKHLVLASGVTLSFDETKPFLHSIHAKVSRK